MIRRLNKILVIFFILAGFHPVLAQPITEQKRITEIETQEKKALSPETITRPKVDYNAESFRDPFQGVVIEEKAPEEAGMGMGREIPLPALSIQGLIWGGKFPQAIINNKVVKAGDTIEGVRIISIEKEGVTAFYEGRQFMLPSPASSTPARKP